MLRGLILFLIAIVVCVKAGTSTSKVVTATTKTVEKAENSIKDFFTSIRDATKGQVHHCLFAIEYVLIIFCLLHQLQHQLAYIIHF